MILYIFSSSDSHIPQNEMFGKKLKRELGGGGGWRGSPPLKLLCPGAWHGFKPVTSYIFTERERDGKAE